MQHKIIVGLGNPKKEYENTRHNVGFMIIDAFGKNHSVSIKKERKFLSFCGSSDEIILAKPTTFMNNSGDAVLKLLSYFKVKQGDLIVVHDEVALDLGKIRISSKRSSAGHHGVESIIQMIGKDFTRLRIGIGPDPGGDVRKDFVLDKFNKQEQSLLNKIINISCEALETIISKGPEKAMDKFNGLELTM